ncbi:hypothetical protein BC829DRAFT_443560 [Chytridium lagenaria]|nr:hypothetical protein BC829DRAFT_443560 [Chytridium lagenaria]
MTSTTMTPLMLADIPIELGERIALHLPALNVSILSHLSTHFRSTWNFTTSYAFVVKSIALNPHVDNIYNAPPIFLAAYWKVFGLPFELKTPPVDTADGLMEEREDAVKRYIMHNGDKVFTTPSAMSWLVESHILHFVPTAVSQFLGKLLQGNDRMIMKEYLAGLLKKVIAWDVKETARLILEETITVPPSTLTLDGDQGNHIILKAIVEFVSSHCPPTYSKVHRSVNALKVLIQHPLQGLDVEVLTNGINQLKPLFWVIGEKMIGRDAIISFLFTNMWDSSPFFDPTLPKSYGIAFIEKVLAEQSSLDDNRLGTMLLAVAHLVKADPSTSLHWNTITDMVVSRSLDNTYFLGRMLQLPSFNPFSKDHSLIKTALTNRHFPTLDLLLSHPHSDFLKTSPSPLNSSITQHSNPGLTSNPSQPKYSAHSTFPNPPSSPLSTEPSGSSPPSPPHHILRPPHHLHQTDLTTLTQILHTLLPSITSTTLPLLLNIRPPRLNPFSRPPPTADLPIAQLLTIAASTRPDIVALMLAHPSFINWVKEEHLVVAVDAGNVEAVKTVIAKCGISEGVARKAMERAEVMVNEEITGLVREIQCV